MEFLTTCHGRSSLMLAAQFGDVQLTRSFIDQGYCLEEVDANGWRVLHHAAYNGHLEVLRLLIEAGAEINRRTRIDRNTALHMTAYKGYPACTKIILNHREINAERRNKNNETALHITAKRMNIDIAKILLDYGANPYAVDRHGNTCLHLAMMSTNFTDEDKTKKLLEIIEILLDRGADIDALNNQRISPLVLAVQNNLYEIVQLLLKRGCTYDLECIDGKTAFYIAVQEGREAISQKLLEVGAKRDVRVQDKMYTTPYHLAATANHNMFNIVFGGGVQKIDLNLRNDEGYDPLMLAIMQMHFENIPKLIACGYDILTEHDTTKDTALSIVSEMQDESILKMLGNHDTLLHSAIKAKSLPIAKTLISLGAEVCVNHLNLAIYYDNKKDFITFFLNQLAKKNTKFLKKEKSGASPMNVAIHKNRWDIVKQLLKHGVKPTSYDIVLAVSGKYIDTIRILKNQEFSLNMTFMKKSSVEQALEDNEKIVEALLKAGANPFSTNNRGMNCHDIAVTRNNPKLLSMINDAMKNLTQAMYNVKGDVMAFLKSDRTQSGNCFYQRAVLENDISLIFFLLENDLDVNEVDEMNRTALHFAVDENQTEIVRVLLNSGARPNIRATIAPYNTPLHLAIKNNNHEVVEMLIKAGADVNVSSETDPAIFFAKKTDMFKTLIEAGCNLQCRNHLNETVLHAAVDNVNEDSFKSVLELLLANNVPLNAYSNVDGGETALFKAIKNKWYQKAEHLIRHGADYNSGRLDPFESSLQLAWFRGRRSPVELMVTAGAEHPGGERLSVFPLTHLARIFIRSMLKNSPRGIYHSLRHIQITGAAYLPDLILEYIMIEY